MDRAEKEVVTVQAEATNPANNFKLVHLQGKTVNETEIVDNEFGVSVENSYRLKRVVEVYQWHETVRTENDKKKYEYSKGWYSHPIDSSHFHDQSGHQNPSTSWPVRSTTIEA